MKRWPLYLCVYFCLCLLAACAAGGSGAPASGGVPSDDAQPGSEIIQPAQATVVCRVVDEEGGQLLLAKQDGGAGDIYTWTVENQNIEAGTLVEVTWGGEIMETYPARFGGEASVTVLEDGFDDRCVLYLDVLEDLWAVDSGLNSDAGLTYLGMDLSATSLSESEQAAVAWTFAGEHGLEPIQGTWDELAEAGYIDRNNLVWEDGCLFSITETDGDENSVTFDAQKWRSGLGAYYFCGCTADRDSQGVWGDYTVRAEAIS